MGACTSDKQSANRLWLIKELLHRVRLMHLASLANTLTLVRSVLWIEDLFGEMAQLTSVKGASDDVVKNSNHDQSYSFVILKVFLVAPSAITHKSVLKDVAREIHLNAC
jgi:hypothetical protein